MELVRKGELLPVRSEGKGTMLKKIARGFQINWTNRYFRREVNNQLKQIRMYDRLLAKTTDPDDIEFYEYEIAYYTQRIRERASLEPTFRGYRWYRFM